MIYRVYPGSAYPDTSLRTSFSILLSFLPLMLSGKRPSSYLVLNSSSDIWAVTEYLSLFHETLIGIFPFCLAYEIAFEVASFKVLLLAKLVEVCEIRDAFLPGGADVIGAIWFKVAI
jgi:hypothetical protein